MRQWLLIGLGGILTAATPAVAQCRYSVTVLPPHDCGAFQSPLGAIALTNTGIVLATFGSCSSVGDDSAWWQGGTAVHTLPRPVGCNSVRAWDISDTGLIVGEARFGTRSRGFIYSIQTGQYTFVEPLAPTGESRAQGISPSGRYICGFRSLTPPSLGGLTQAFVQDLTTGVITDLGLYNRMSTSAADVNDAGAVTGNLILRGIPQPYLWHGTGFVPLGTLGSETYPFAISESNDVVGWSAQRTPPYLSRAFMWRDGTMSDLGVLAGDNRSAAWSSNSAGSVVGLSRYLDASTQVDHGFIWRYGVMRNLNDLVEANVGIADASAIDEAGVILAHGRVDGLPVTMLLSPQSITGDVVLNCRVDIDDLVKVITEWGKLKSPADLNNDGVVGLEDLVIVIQNWTTS